MPITTAVTASKKAGAPAPQSALATNLSGDTESEFVDVDMGSDLSSLSDMDEDHPNVEIIKEPFPLELREEKEPSNIVCGLLIDLLC
jgi:hypothetical protein